MVRGGVGEEFEEILRWRLDTLSKKVAKDSTSDDLCVVDGSVVVRLRWSEELMLFQSRLGLGIEDWMSLALNFLFAQVYGIYYLQYIEFYIQK